MIVFGNGVNVSKTVGTTAQWEAVASMIPSKGVVCIDSNTGKVRVGDGITDYGNLQDTSLEFVVDVSSVTTVIHGDSL